MFQTRKETTYNHQTYSRLQQQDDGDDDLDYEDGSDLAQHPHSVLVTNMSRLDGSDGYATVVLPQPLPNNISSSNSTSTSNNNSVILSAVPSATPTSGQAHPSSTVSFLPNDRLAKLPQATRDYFHNKWLPTKANKATLANIPPVIVYDIQQGNVPSHTDPTLRELDIRGWTIVHRRLYRVKKQKAKKQTSKKTNDINNNAVIAGGGDTTDEDAHPFLDSSSPLQPSNQLSASVFIKTEYNDGSAMHMSDDTKINSEPIPVSKDVYLQIVEAVRLAINDNIQPTRISQGSSGSYFCRDQNNKIVGVFKPKNEEPYGQLNPKWAKWIHRHLFPCCFGRSCLIPNLGYISEAAASLVDRQLGTCIVPTTNLDHFTSSSFHYDYLDRRRYRLSPQQHPLPLKIGSFQCFLHGYRDANVFLRDHPWPLESSSMSLMRFGGTGSAVWSSCLGQSDDDHHDENDDGKDLNGQISDISHDGKRKGPPSNTKYGYQPVHNDSNRPSSPRGSANGGYVTLNMSSSGDDEDDENDSDTLRNRKLFYKGKSQQKSTFQWTPQLQSQFKREFEHLVILDYLIRNTDRGLDNWMIRYCEADTSNMSPKDSSDTSVTSEQAPSSACRHGNTVPHIHIAAIDNGLAFPFKHPDEWRSYPYGWLALPSSLVARPFSEETRRRFLPILSDPVWWYTTVEQLRQLFQVDPDFNERMFQRQMSVLRGQGYNLVRALKDPHAGPVDLVAMERILVKQEEVIIEYDEKRLEERLPPRKNHRDQDRNRHPHFNDHQQADQESVSSIPSPEIPDLSDSRRTVTSCASVPISAAKDVTTSKSSVSSSMPSQVQTVNESLLQSNVSLSPSISPRLPQDYHLQQHKQLPQRKNKNGTRRIRPKRSTSFNTFDTTVPVNTPSASTSATLSNRSRVPWKDRVKKRMSLDMGRRRLKLRQVVGSDGEMGEDDSSSMNSFDDQQEPARRRVLFVMETIKLVKSKLPYFSCW